MRQVDFTTCFNMTVEAESFAMVDQPKIIILQIGDLCLHNESRGKNSDELHAPASIASRFPLETQLDYDLAIHSPPAATARARTGGRRLEPPPPLVALWVGRETGGGDPRVEDIGASPFGHALHGKRRPSARSICRHFGPSAGVMKVTDSPWRPIRPVRPTR